MWIAIAYFIGIILLLVGLWLFAASTTTVDPVSASQKKTWSVVLLIIGFFLILLSAASVGYMGGGCGATVARYY